VSCFDGLKDVDDRVTTSARAWASPASYVGPCTPGDKIDFVGLIKVDSPRWVHYRWVLNGDVVDHGKVKVWNTRKVGFGFSPRESQRGSAVLEVLGEGGTDSNRAYYKVWCKDGGHDETKVSVSSPVTASDHANCPTGKVGAHANISSTGPGRVEYVWKLNGSKVAAGSVVFSKSGTENVSLANQTLTGDSATKGGTVTIEITGRSNGDSASQSYVAPCKGVPAATTVKTEITAVHDQSTCKDGKGSTINVTATVTANGSGSVTYQLWSEVGGFSKSGTLSFADAGSQSVSLSLPASGTNGVKIKATLSNGASHDNLVTYGDHCPAPVAAVADKAA
jgi:hypothetical protein